MDTDVEFPQSSQEHPGAAGEHSHLCLILPPVEMVCADADFLHNSSEYAGGIGELVCTGCLIPVGSTGADMGIPSSDPECTRIEG